MSYYTVDLQSKTVPTVLGPQRKPLGLAAGRQRLGSLPAAVCRLPAAAGRLPTELVNFKNTVFVQFSRVQSSSVEFSRQPASSLPAACWQPAAELPADLPGSGVRTASLGSSIVLVENLHYKG